MDALHPTLWRTCRVLANEKRLQLLWKLFQSGESSVTSLGDAVGLTEPGASAYLRALNARGLILPRREKTFVYYRVESNPEVAGAPELLEGLKGAYDAFMPLSHVMKQLTAFTHERRIVIVRTLAESSMEESALSIKAGISPQALYRHVRKLRERGYVERADQKIFLTEQENPLGKVLLSLALSS